ncbi:MAG TPA: heat-inducible transcriptional repressor HrcA [Nitrospinota bacterium]|nr:heat-inducible transcriptional repressor HrcA [Nitrospinota bacterium]|tara:strand:- start:20119 stop:21165 length:1047 start_codon:yes stop_codon:yes gene_type:complete
MLKERPANILKAVVEKYIKTGDPVGANSLTKSFALSPASIRNALASLESQGFLTHPHTSAGRIPTDLGYRYYAQTLVDLSNLNDCEMESLKGATGDQGWIELDYLLQSVSLTLSSLSKHASMVGIANPGVAPVRRISFAYVDDYVFLAILVTDDSEILKKLIRTENCHRRSDLDKFSNYFNDRFTHLSIMQIKRMLIKELQKEENHLNRLLTFSLFIVEEMKELSLGSQDGQIAVEGTANLIAQAKEKADLWAVKMIFEAMEEKNRLFSLLAECRKKEGVSLVIGSESEIEELNDYSMISHGFDGKNGLKGAVGIIGQKQMDYRHSMALVTFAAKEMSERLSKRTMGL